jgi:hypothetical protein
VRFHLRPAKHDYFGNFRHFRASSGQLMSLF